MPSPRTLVVGLCRQSRAPFFFFGPFFPALWSRPSPRLSGFGGTSVLSFCFCTLLILLANRDLIVVCCPRSIGPSFNSVLRPTFRDVRFISLCTRSDHLSIPGLGFFVFWLFWSRFIFLGFPCAILLSFNEDIFTACRKLRTIWRVLSRPTRPRCALFADFFRPVAVMSGSTLVGAVTWSVASAFSLLVEANGFGFRLFSSFFSFFFPLFSFPVVFAVLIETALFLWILCGPLLVPYRGCVFGFPCILSFWRLTTVATLCCFRPFLGGYYFIGLELLPCTFFGLGLCNEGETPDSIPDRKRFVALFCPNPPWRCTKSAHRLTRPPTLDTLFAPGGFLVTLHFRAAKSTAYVAVREAAPPQTCYALSGHRLTVHCVFVFSASSSDGRPWVSAARGALPAFFLYLGAFFLFASDVLHSLFSSL